MYNTCNENKITDCIMKVIADEKELENTLLV